MNSPANGTAVARRDDTPKPLVSLTGPIADLDSAYRYAVALAQADILPQDLRGKPSNVLLIILYGQYLNIPPVISTQVISVVKGRPQIAGKMLLAKVREAGHKPKIVHGDGKCTVTITRGDDGSDHTEEYTLNDAVTAKLCTVKDGKTSARSKSGEPLPWENHPKRMLMWRAVGHCVDVICPEVKMGFAVEGEESTDDDTRPSLAQVAAQRADHHPEAPAIEVAARTDEAIAAEIAEISAQHTSEPVVDQLPLDEEMEAEIVAYEAEQAATAAEGGTA